MAARVHFEGAGTNLPSDNITGSGTVNQVAKFTGINAIGDSIITDTGTNVGIGETSPTARLQIKGSGATSATTAVLVQNSAGTSLLKVLDNGVSIVGNTLYGGFSYTLGVGLNLGQVGTSGGGGFAISFWDNGYSINYAKFTKSNVCFSSGTVSSIATAQLQIDSTTKGFLPPRMTSVQLAAIASPAAGLVVYDNTTNELKYYNGTVWVIL